MAHDQGVLRAEALGGAGERLGNGQIEERQFRPAEFTIHCAIV